MWGHFPQVATPRCGQTQSFSSLLPKALSAVLHSKLPTTGLDPDPQPSRDPARRTPANLEQLQTELRDLRDQFNQMKSQHKYTTHDVISVCASQPLSISAALTVILCSSKEIKLLMSELDEEKRIRLTLQVGIEQLILTII